MEIMCLSLWKIAWVQTVSYTHLDVYKRQLQMCADLPMGDLVDLQWLHQWVIMVVKGDVYKRQVCTDRRY